ncbi:MAG: hypothetical protein AABZ61_12750 [Bacteroidota bacterium]
MNNDTMNAKVLNEYAREYDEWFDTHVAVYESEVEAVRRFVPKKGLGVDIGVGTGRFSVTFSVTIGVEPSPVSPGRDEADGSHGSHRSLTGNRGSSSPSRTVTVSVQTFPLRIDDYCDLFC